MADFIGEANLIYCAIEQVQGDTATVRIGELQIELPAREQLTDEAVIAVRPSSFPTRSASKEVLNSN